MAKRVQVYEMQAYLKRTEVKREKERKRTNEYIMTRREFSRDKYNEKSTKTVNGVKLNDSDIIFKSQYKSVVIANCTVNEINNIAKNNNTENISVYIVSDSQEECTDTRVESTKASVSYNEVINKFGLTGNGVVIGMFETGRDITSNSALYNRTDLFDTVGDVSPKSHVANAACILVHPDRGLCPEAFIYSTGKEKYSNIKLLLEEERNVSIINASCSMSVDNAVYSTNDKWVDHIVSYHGVAVVAYADNYDTEGYRILSPAMGNNVIAVAGYNQNANSTDPTDKLTILYVPHSARQALPGRFFCSNINPKPVVSYSFI